MADPVGPMSTAEVAKGLGSLLATMKADQPVEGVEREAVPEQEQDVELSLGDQTEEEAPESVDEEDETDETEDESEFSLTYKYKGQDYQITDPAEAAKFVQLGKHLSERQDEIVRREKASEEVFTEADQSRTRYAVALQEVAQFFDQVVGTAPKEGDFQDRTAFLEAVNQHNQAQQAVTAYRSELQRVQAEQADAQRKHLERWAAEQENETLTAVPEWHDMAVRQADVRAMGEYAEAIGVPAQALANPMLVNAKWFRLMLRDAMRYKKAADIGGSEVKKKQTKEAAPGSGGEVRYEGRTRQKRVLEDRAKSGKIDDIAPLATMLIERTQQLNRQAKRR